MKTSIEVEDRKEGDLIRRGLESAEVRAFVKIMGALSVLPTDRAKARALNFVADHFAEQEA